MQIRSFLEIRQTIKPAAIIKNSRLLFIGTPVLLLLISWLAASRYAEPERQSPFVDDALAHSEKAAEALARMKQGMLRFSQGDYREAEAIFSSIAAALPDVRHAVAMAALLELPNAGTYRRIVSALYSNLGLAQMRSRRYSQAVTSLEKAISADPHAFQPRSNLGIIFLRQKGYAAAAHELESVMRYGEADAELYLNLGESYLGLGDHGRARWAFMQAKRLSDPPKHVRQWGELLEADRGLAKVYFREGRLDESKRYLESVLARAAGDSEARYLLVRILARQGHRDIAEKHKARFDRDSQTIADIQSVLASTPGKVDALQWVADTYRELGLLHMAYVHYKQLESRDPGNSQLQLAMLDLQQRINKQE